ncbi:OLC1v1031689C1 [Oldenlandia corymbosa var. corymbosa]|uniref:OLC1v1031689C1 n=1 Tax=Oldenlandia corymbosa var. corymbosa TaxID=529605 RepID=A0AAV1CKW1_OLDCO|nr:OLC1v1031689C1 [Oldenlandia corymbosa var. corymbosa]
MDSRRSTPFSHPAANWILEHLFCLAITYVVTEHIHGRLLRYTDNANPPDGENTYPGIPSSAARPFVQPRKKSKTTVVGGEGCEWNHRLTGSEIRVKANIIARTASWEGPWYFQLRRGLKGAPKQAKQGSE